MLRALVRFRKETEAGLGILPVASEVQFVTAVYAPEFVAMSVSETFSESFVLSKTKFRTKSRTSFRQRPIALGALESVVLFHRILFQKYS
jgi:hypothetical protein